MTEREPIELDPEFERDLGAFWAIWTGVELDTCYAVGKFLRLTHEEAHILTVGMEFGRKATLLRLIVARSNDANKAALLGALNRLQNDAKRNIFAHAFLLVFSDKSVAFLERSGKGGKFTAEYHSYTLAEFKAHVQRVTKHAGELRGALNYSDSERDAFGQAARSAANKPSPLPVSPIDNA